MKNSLVKKSYFISKHTGMKIQTSAYFTCLTFLNPTPYQLTWYTFAKVIRQDRDWFPCQAFLIPPSRLFGVKLKELSQATSHASDWVLSDGTALAQRGPLVFAALLSILETRPEFFPGTRTHSSDRTMDMGLAEDHFSRPMVSETLWWNCHIPILACRTSSSSNWCSSFHRAHL